MLEADLPSSSSSADDLIGRVYDVPPVDIQTATQRLTRGWLSHTDINMHRWWVTMCNILYTHLHWQHAACHPRHSIQFLAYNIIYKFYKWRNWQSQNLTMQNMLWQETYLTWSMVAKCHSDVVLQTTLSQCVSKTWHFLTRHFVIHPPILIIFVHKIARLFSYWSDINILNSAITLWH